MDSWNRLLALLDQTLGFPSALPGSELPGYFYADYVLTSRAGSQLPQACARRPPGPEVRSLLPSAIAHITVGGIAYTTCGHDRL